MRLTSRRYIWKELESSCLWGVCHNVRLKWMRISFSTDQPSLSEQSQHCMPLIHYQPHKLYQQLFDTSKQFRKTTFIQYHTSELRENYKSSLLRICAYAFTNSSAEGLSEGLVLLHFKWRDSNSKRSFALLSTQPRKASQTSGTLHMSTISS